MKMKKTINILMWIPLIGIPVGILHPFFYNSWFYMRNPRLVILNALVQGIIGGFILRILGVSL